MGFRFSDDGECKVCKHYTNKFCDACNKYICDKHSYEKPVEKSLSKKHLFCKECYEKGKKPINADLKGLNPDYHF